MSVSGPFFVVAVERYTNDLGCEVACACMRACMYVYDKLCLYCH